MNAPPWIAPCPRCGTPVKHWQIGGSTSVSHAHKVTGCPVPGQAGPVSHKRRPQAAAGVAAGAPA